MIYLAPSNQYANRYSYGEYTEAEVCRMIAREAASFIAPHEAVRVSDARASMQAWVAESNNMNARLHVPIHTDAGRGRAGLGPLIMHYSPTHDNPYQNVYDSLCNVVPWQGVGIRSNNALYELKQTVAPSIYIEVAAHDVSETAQWIVEHVAEIGRAIGEGLLGVAAPVEVDSLIPLSDGIVGPVTARAIQAKIGATQDGVLGYESAAKLQAYSKSAYSDGRYDCPTVALGPYWPAAKFFHSRMRPSDSWRDVQRMIGTTPDGVPGPKDAAAIQRWAR